VIGAGVVLRVDGVPARLDDDGTTRLVGTNRLEEGDTYSVRAYAPNPTRKQMQGAPRGYNQNLARYTAISLPRPGESVTDELSAPEFVRDAAMQSRESVFVPLRDSTQTDWGVRADRMLRQSPYQPMYERALELTRDAPNAYDASRYARGTAASPSSEMV
jgi:hypothetical protein